MPTIEWTKELSVGIHEIDEQHKKWVEIINELHHALMCFKGNDDLKKTLIKEMADYTDYHFSEEEKYMQEIAYPNYENHKNIHEWFKVKINQLKGAVTSGERVLAREIMKVLQHWLVGHIMKEDKYYA